MERCLTFFFLVFNHTRFAVSMKISPRCPHLQSLRRDKNQSRVLSTKLAHPFRPVLPAGIRERLCIKNPFGCSAQAWIKSRGYLANTKV